MSMTLQQIELGNTFSFTWKKTKFPKKNTSWSTTKRTKEIAQIFTWPLISIVIRAKSWFCSMVTMCSLVVKYSLFWTLFIRSKKWLWLMASFYWWETIKLRVDFLEIFHLIICRKEDSGNWEDFSLLTSRLCTLMWCEQLKRQICNMRMELFTITRRMWRTWLQRLIWLELGWNFWNNWTTSIGLILERTSLTSSRSSWSFRFTISRH